MCEQCLAETITYGDPMPGISLVRATRDGQQMKAAQWGLVVMNDPFLIFDIKPEPDPAHGWTDEQVDAAEDDHPLWAWLEVAGAFRDTFKVDPNLGHDLVEIGKTLGYDRENDGDFAMWLFHRMGEVVLANPSPTTPSGHPPCSSSATPRR